MIGKLSGWIRDFSENKSAQPGAEHEWAVTVATLLVEAAMADGALDEDERALIAHALVDQLSLDQNNVDKIIDDAVAAHDDRTEIHSVTREIRAQTDAEDRITIMEMVWVVVLADGKMHSYEAQLMRRLAGLLYVDDVDSGKAAKRARARLGL